MRAALNAERALRESEERFRLVTEATGDAIYDWNLKTGTIWRSEGYVHLLQPPSSLSKREDWWEAHLHPEDREQTRASLQAALDRQDRVWTSEYRFQRDDGVEVFLADHALIVYDETGRPTRIVGAMSDITARKWAEEQRRRYAERLSILHEIDQAIQVAQSPEAIAQAALPRLRRLVPCRRASVSLMDFSARESFLLAVDVTGETCFPTGTRLPFSALTIVDPNAFRQGRAEEVEDLLALVDLPPVGHRLRAEGIRTHLHIPLIARGETIGSLSLGKETPGAFSSEHKEIIQEIASSLAVALYQARLYEQVQRHAEELERKVTERTAELQERQRFIEQIANTTPTMLYLYDVVRNRIVYVNAHVTEILGYTPEGVVQARAGSVSDFIHSEDLARVIERFQRYATAKDGEIFPLEYRMRHRNGEWRWLRDQATVFTRTADGTPRQVLGSAQDITERKQAEEALRRSEEYFRALIENATDVIMVLRPDGSIHYRSPTATGRGVHGYRPEELVGKKGIDFIHPEDRPRVRAVFAEALKRRGMTSLPHFRVRRSDGSWRMMEAVLNNLLENPAVAGVVYTGRDITERKQAEEELRRAKEAAETANRAKTEFLATMSHELRTPLNIIIGYTGLLCEEAFGSLLTKQAEILQRVSQRARELHDLITAMLDLAAMEAGRMRIQVQEVRVPALFQELEDEFQELRERSGLTWTWKSDPHVSTVATDPSKLKIVLKNLIGNAVKFTNSGGITVAARGRDGGIEISVTDTGIGIPSEALQTIFTPFYQLDNSHTRQYEGSGLGLHIVKRLVELLGGVVTVESEVGRGSTFRVWVSQWPRLGSPPP